MDRPLGVLPRWAGLCCSPDGPMEQGRGGLSEGKRMVNSVDGQVGTVCLPPALPRGRLCTLPPPFGSPNTILPGVTVPRKPTLSPDASAQLTLEQPRLELHRPPETRIFSVNTTVLTNQGYHTAQDGEMKLNLAGP